MANIGLADDKAGTALDIFRSIGNLMLEIEGADKDKVSSWGRWVQSTKEVLYDAKSSLNKLPVQMLLAGWGDDYKKEFFLGHSTFKLPSDVFDEFVNYLRPSLVVVEHKVAKMLKEIDALPHKEKQWQCNQKARTCLTDMQKSVQQRGGSFRCSCMACLCCLTCTQQRGWWLCVVVSRYAKCSKMYDTRSIVYSSEMLTRKPLTA